MQCMKKLKITLLYNNLHFLFILLILTILSMRYWYFIPVLLFYIIYLFKKTPLFYIGVILSIIVLISSIRYHISFNEKIFTGLVIDSTSEEATISSNGSLVLIYHDNILSTGDYGRFSVKELDYSSDLFDYKEYLLSKDIKNYYKLEEFVYIDNYFVISKINNFFINLVNEKNNTISNKYINSLIFADKSNLDIKEAATDLGISHLLAVSGMHISILVLIFEFILKKLFYFEKPVDIIVIIFLLMYIVITNFEITVLRASLMVIFSKHFKMRKYLFTKLDILSLVGILCLLVSPYILFSLSFQLSFLVSFIIIIFGDEIKSDNKIIKTYLISLIAFLTTLPLIVNVNYEINFLSILTGPIYILYFELILYPSTILLLFFPQLSFILDYVYLLFEYSVITLSSVKEFRFIVGELNIISCLIYYGLLYLVLISFSLKRGRILSTITMIVFILIVYNKAYFSPFFKLRVYDVGQGESIILQLPYNRGNILFDCYNNVGDYLKRDGIRDIDIVFISHGHSDHMNAYLSLQQDFNINKTLSSYYDKTTLLNEIKQSYNISLLKSGDTVNYKDFNCEVLGPIRYYEKENNNSLVLKVTIDDLTILFTGDIENEAEDDLINKYKDYLKSDILKVPHHGSLSSCSYEFLSYVNPKELVVCVGKNNYYNFPSNTYVLRSNNLYRTDIDGMITFYKRRKFYYVKK